MANIKKVVPAPVPPPPTYVVELTEAEAQGLRILLTHGTSRGALDLLGLTHLHRELEKGAGQLPSIKFTKIAIAEAQRE